MPFQTIGFLFQGVQKWSVSKGEPGVVVPRHSDVTKHAFAKMGKRLCTKPVKSCSRDRGVKPTITDSIGWLNWTYRMRAGQPLFLKDLPCNHRNGNASIGPTSGEVSRSETERSASQRREPSCNPPGLTMLISPRPLMASPAPRQICQSSRGNRRRAACHGAGEKGREPRHLRGRQPEQIAQQKGLPIPSVSVRSAHALCNNRQEQASPTG